MDVKTKIIAEIDRQISIYEDKRENPSFTSNNLSDLERILGAIHALNELKAQVGNLNIEDCSTIPIIQEEIRRLEQIRTIIQPDSFLNRVLLKIKFTLNLEESDGSRGSGANPNAMPGRIEACERIANFVLELDAEIKNEHS